MEISDSFARVQLCRLRAGEGKESYTLHRIPLCLGLWKGANLLSEFVPKTTPRDCLGGEKETYLKLEIGIVLQKGDLGVGEAERALCHLLDFRHPSRTPNGRSP